MEDNRTNAAQWLTRRWQKMGFTHESLSETSGVSLRTLGRIQAGYAPDRLTVVALMMPLSYGKDVSDLLLDGPVDPDALDALAAPTDALSRVGIVPEPYRGRTLFFRRVGRGLPPYVARGAIVTCLTGPPDDGPALVEFRRGLLAVRFARRQGDSWELRETPRGAAQAVSAGRVRRVSKVLFESRLVG